MKTLHLSLRIVMSCILLMTGYQAAFAQDAAPAPGISIYQYRRVPADKRDEFIRRETTYYAEVARKALAQGNLTFWGLFEKVGGEDMEHDSNFLFINTFNDIDKIGEVWSEKAVAAAFPNVPMSKIETGSMSTTMRNMFILPENFRGRDGAVPDKEYNYVVMIYHDATDPAALIDLEKKHWAPFIKTAMDKKQVMQGGWGNARLLSPSGPQVPFTTISYDIFPTLKEALNPTWDPAVVFPTAGLEEIGKLEKGRMSYVYHAIKVVN